LAVVAARSASAPGTSGRASRAGLARCIGATAALTGRATLPGLTLPRAARSAGAGSGSGYSGVRRGTTAVLRDPVALRTHDGVEITERALEFLVATLAGGIAAATVAERTVASTAALCALAVGALTLAATCTCTATVLGRARVATAASTRPLFSAAAPTACARLAGRTARAGTAVAAARAGTAGATAAASGTATAGGRAAAR